MRKYISKILDGIFHCDADITINGLSSNSKEIKDRYIFCALSDNANNYIDDAIRNGAAAIISNKRQDRKMLQFTHPNPKIIWHKIANNFYGKQPKNICAVTGTNGKTSVVHFFQEICDLAGINNASIGTAGLKSNISSINADSSLTSPDSADLHRMLSHCTQRDIDHVAIEASSHGIDQHRMDSVEINSAAFTNLSHEHLDYHGNLANYFDAKLPLFTKLLKTKKTAVINIDNRHGLEIIRKLDYRKNIITYGRNNADLQILNQIPSQEGQNVRIKIFNRIYEFPLRIFGKFQLHNLLASIGLSISSNVDIASINFSMASSPIGRMNCIPSQSNKKIFVDYAHTPDGLKNALMSLKWHFPGQKISIVFGCGGSRDQEKRPIMGKIAESIASRVIITNDNPRNEDPKKIREDVMNGCKNAIEIENRQEAIEYAIVNGEDNCVILVTGRGNENIQKFKNHHLEFNDMNFISSLNCK